MSPKTYIGADGIERSVDDIIGSGTFYIVYDRREAAVRRAVLWVMFGWPVLFVITSGLLLFAQLIMVRFTAVHLVTDAIEDFLNALGFSSLVIILSLILFPIAGIMFLKFYVRGKECRYRANGEEFTVFEKDKTEHIYYSDVIEVSYTPRQLLKKYEHGYDVKIVTKYKTIVYKYIFPRLNELVNPENLPFRIIQEHIPE